MATGEELGRLAWEHWGKNGVAVFPCGDKGAQKKVPLCFWKQDASCDKDTIIQLFAARGDRAKYIGAVMGEDSGLFAVDFDLYKGKGAKAYLETLLLAKCLPPTRVHKTMSGGLHYIYFAPDGVPVPRNSVPADGVEIRGQGGYIIVPPTDNYSVESSETVEAPIALINRLARADAAFKALSVSGLVSKIISGESFHEALTSIAAKLHSKGEEPAKIMKTMQEAMEASVAANPRHHRHDRWLAIMEGKDGELARLSESAYRKYNPRRDQVDVDTVAGAVVEAVTNRNRDVTLGGFFSAVPNAFSGKTFKNPARVKKSGAAANPATAAAPAVDEFPFERAYTASKVEDEDNRNFLIYPLIMEGDVVVLSAEPKAGKTLTAMSICLHAAAGVAFGDLTPLDSKGNLKKIPIVYFALEGQGAVRKRIKGWLAMYKQRYNLSGDPDDLRIFVVERPINLAVAEAKQELVDKLMLTEAYFKRRGWGGIGMVVFDTLTKAMPGKDQNSVEDTSEVFNVVDMMREVDLNPAVMFIHHNNKNSKSPRGSSNILAEPDTIIAVSKAEAPVMLNGQAVDVVEMSIYMARAIDDGQVYRFANHNVEIGENSQGIMESAPVQEVLENYQALPTQAQATIATAVQASKREFYEVLWTALSDAPGMSLTFGQAVARLKERGKERALAYYSQHVNVNTKEGATAAWKVLLHTNQVPPSMQGMAFYVTENGIAMEIDLGQPKARGA